MGGTEHCSDSAQHLMATDKQCLCRGCQSHSSSGLLDELSTLRYNQYCSLPISRTCPSDVNHGLAHELLGLPSMLSCI